MSKINQQLLKMAMDNVERLHKQSFVPPPTGGAPPMGPPPGAPMDPGMGGMPMDPAMMGGMPPMDPAMMSGMPPMDPAMMGGAPAGPVPGEAVMDEPVPAPGGGEGDMKSQIKEVLTETGVIKPDKKKPEQQYAELESKLDVLLTHFGLHDQVTKNLSDATEDPTAKKEEPGSAMDSQGQPSSMDSGSVSSPDISGATGGGLAGLGDMAKMSSGPDPRNRADDIRNAIKRFR